MNAQEKQDEMQRRIAACVNAFEGISTDRIEGKNLGEILAGEMRLHGAGPRADGGFGFEFSGGVCQLLAEAYAEQFKQSGAINYLELLFQHSDIGPLTITMQRVEGLTPAQKLSQAEAERDALQAKLAELQKQKPVGTVSIAMDWNTHRNIATVNMRPDLVLAEMKDGDELFTRPTPAVSLAELEEFALYMADESVKAGNYPEGWQCKASNAAQEYLEACRAAILRNIEESGLSKPAAPEVE